MRRRRRGLSRPLFARASDASGASRFWSETFANRTIKLLLFLSSGRIARTIDQNDSWQGALTAYRAEISIPCALLFDSVNERTIKVKDPGSAIWRLHKSRRRENGRRVPRRTRDEWFMTSFRSRVFSVACDVTSALVSFRFLSDFK